MAKKRKWRATLVRRWNRNALINRFGCVCGVCKKPIEKMKDVTIDHIIPRARGGMDVLENMQLAHYACNIEKSCMLPEEFEAFQRVEIYERA